MAEKLKATVELRKIEHEEFLKYEFTPAEMTDMSKALARKTSELARLAEKKKAVVAQIGADIAKVEGEQQSLANNVTNGYDYRNIKCETLFHAPKTGVKTTVRKDTGEVVCERAMSGSEMQEALPFDGGRDAR